MTERLRIGIVIAVLLTTAIRWPVAESADVPVPPTDPLLAAAAALLSDWIAASREQALAEGVAAIPTAIRAELLGYVPGAVLDAVRWRIGGGDPLSLQHGMLRLGDSPAITLDHVIVFEDQAAADDPRLWAHELMHVMQFRRWGVGGFATRYVTDYEAVEAEAVEYRWQWMKRTGRVPGLAAQPEMATP